MAGSWDLEKIRKIHDFNEMGHFGALYQAHHSSTDHHTWCACSPIPSNTKYQRICRSELRYSLQDEAKSRFFTKKTIFFEKKLLLKST